MFDIRGIMRLEKFIQINPRPIYKHSLQYLVIAHHSNLLNEIIEKIVQKFSKYNSSRFSRFGGNIGWAEKSLCEIAHSCNKIKQLDLYGVVHISDSSISKIATKCPSIVYLDLRHAEFISNTTLKAVAEHLNSIEYLGLKNCYRISQKIVDKIFPGLKIGGYYTFPN
ncbi:hypothetical protein RhiirA4_451631 [Rhizophagus irregularis]|uniref:F-box/LRR-repeat protein 15-like leucin rich repeat domain-containing protein n=1 Tax=Rhizophagus irregularis TaxID=588596 RepID=A0A2I1FW69_9GLOM|nr:hypothetical protein RhiirA4_451631 [Rhizophagus irregularis]